MLSVDVCGCYTFDKEFYPTHWRVEVTLKKYYNAKTVANMTYSTRPFFAFIPTRAARANVSPQPRTC